MAELDVAIVGAGFGRRTVWETGCHSWYTTGGRNTNNWPTYPFRYQRQLRRFDLRDYGLTPAAPPGS
jgi:hypothetical protein